MSNLAKYCGGPFDLDARHTKTNWEHMEVTGAEYAVTSYLATVLEASGIPRSLLHIGFGNGHVFDNLADRLAMYVGTTISQPEIRQFAQRYELSDSVRIFLANKHDPRAYESYGGLYDVIVDVNIKSFACCEQHYEEYIEFIVSCLNPGGLLLTAQSGIDFGWTCNTARGFTPGIEPNPDFATGRTLGVSGLRALAKAHELDVAAVTLPTIERGEPVEETVWILKKKR